MSAVPRAALHQLVQASFGLLPRPTWTDETEHALVEMSRRHGLPADEVPARIFAEPALLRELAGYLTIQESHFLRHPEQFEVLAEHLGPRLFPMAPGSIAVWSAGCASGEEPYSVAILLEERFGEGVFDRVRITASDLSRAAVERAAQGRYRAWSFRGTPPWLVARYFTEAPSQQLQLAARVRSRVHFRHQAVEETLAQLAPASLDVILFRNVAIYLESALLDLVYRRFREVLRATGLLLIAPADPRPPNALFVPASDIPGVLRPAGATDRRARKLDTAGAPAGGRERRWCADEDETAVADYRRSAARHGGAQATRRPHAPRREETPGRGAARRPNAAEKFGDARPPSSATSGPAGERRPESGGEPDVDEPATKDGYLERGMLRLQDLRIEDAIGDLRRVVFLDGGDRMARYWYATALLLAGRREQAHGQVSALGRLLRRAAPDDVLEDGCTTARELQTALRVMGRHRS